MISVAHPFGYTVLVIYLDNLFDWDSEDVKYVCFSCGNEPFFRSGDNFTGNRFCVYPNTDHDTGSNGQTLDLGIYPDVSTDTSLLDILPLWLLSGINSFYFYL